MHYITPEILFQGLKSRRKMGEARSTYMGEKMCMQGLWENLR
jgi:hypothetical protein